jgi:hypothetical protein
MNNLTNNQQTIINQIIGEFNRMNTTNNSSKGFNLIDINPLQKINREIKEFKELASADSKAWETLAHNEAQRIVDLLKEDLKGYSVQKYGEGNTYNSSPSILIRNNDKAYTDFSNSIDIDVRVAKQTKSIHGSNCNFGVALYYTFYSTPYHLEEYNTIEGLLNSEDFQDRLRKVVIK